MSYFDDDDIQSVVSSNNSDDEAGSDAVSESGSDPDDDVVAEMGEDDEMLGEDVEVEVEEQDGGGGDEDDDAEDGLNEIHIKHIGAADTENKQDKDDELSDDDSDDDETGKKYANAFRDEMKRNFILENHPECVKPNFDEVEAMTHIVRDKNNVVIDDLHRTLSILTKYEMTDILGKRTTQLNRGAMPFVKVPDNIIDGKIIAEMELKAKACPFIIRRFLPNGGCEYWKVCDLEIL